MDSQGLFIGALLDSSSKALAAGAVTRLQEVRGEEAIESLGFSRLVSDTQVKLQALAEALAAGRPELLALDVDWTKATYRSRGVPLDLIEQILQCVRAELGESLPSDAAQKAQSFLDIVLGKIAEPHPEPQSLLQDDAPHVDTARAFMLAILEARRLDAEKLILDAFESGVSVPDLHEHVISKVQAEMGRMWQVGEIHIAEEHIGSRMVEDNLAVLRNRMPRSAPTGRSVLTSSVPGNLHDIGARLVADQFEMAGWSSIFLGANTPAEDLALAVQQFKPDLVALSIGLALNVRVAAQVVSVIRKENGPEPPILVGGQPFNAVDGLWRDVGADGSAGSAPDAVRVGTELVSG